MDDEAIDQRWERLVEVAEAAAAASWLNRHLLPLSSAIPDFEVRKIRALSAAHGLAEEAAATHRVEESAHRLTSGYEVPVETADGQAGGRIDAVKLGPDGPVLRDYKSGAIHEGATGNARTVKAAYAAQLKLYAAIYAEMTGVWPSLLEVVPLAGMAEQVEFTRDECVQLLRDAMRLRDTINDVINSDTSLAARIARLATPAQSVCSYCAYRPTCTPYMERERFEQGGWPLDVSGELTNKRTLGNGRMVLVLTAGTTVIQIRGLSAQPERHPAIAATDIGDTVAAFNLRADGPSSFAEGPFTVLYKIP